MYASWVHQKSRSPYSKILWVCWRQKTRTNPKEKFLLKRTTHVAVVTSSGHRCHNTYININMIFFNELSGKIWELFIWNSLHRKTGDKYYLPSTLPTNSKCCRNNPVQQHWVVGVKKILMSPEWERYTNRKRHNNCGYTLLMSAKGTNVE